MIESDLDRLREAEKCARQLARKIKKGLPAGWLFTLNLFDAQGEHATYISNASPEDVPAAMRECADYIEKREAGRTPRGM